MNIDDAEIKKALYQIARTPDGLLLYRYLQKVRCVVTTDATPECALPRLEGRRSFAASLMADMAQGIEDSGSHTDAVVTFARAKSAAISSPGGAGRRVTADTFVPGYDTPDPGAGA